MEADPADLEAVSYHSRILYVHQKQSTGFQAGAGHDTILQLVDVKTLIFKFPQPDGSPQYRKLDVPSFIKDVLKIPFGGDREPASMTEHLNQMPSWEIATIASRKNRSELDPTKTTAHKFHPIGNDWHLSSAHAIENRIVPSQDRENMQLMRHGEKPSGAAREGTRHDDRISAELGSTLHARDGDDLIKLHSFKRHWEWTTITTKIHGGDGMDTVELEEISGLLEVERSSSGKCVRIKERFYLNNDTSKPTEALYKYYLRDVELLKISDLNKNSQTYNLSNIKAAEKKFFSNGVWYIPDETTGEATETLSMLPDDDPSICAQPTFQDVPLAH
ncbi:hypothetical protein GCM10010136_25030 [Limoniibacter endophyticus]|uniref:Uncharacterized protein n=1 Tax=Limoniibacter endophyticus TaxID=1565040 RepID=A0A8J3DTL0_9HYPH|nr:hypothetical protein GCM10010136_25030 [Limoniibacter endophyticus]